MVRPILLIILAFLGFENLSGQQLEGKITEQNGAPIPDAYILRLSGNEHTHSNELGYFQYDGFRAGDTLRVSSMGFKTQELILEEADFENPVTIVLKAYPLTLQQVLISSQTDAMNQISKIDLENIPVNSSQELLRKVPGLFIAQHAGGGKAEQIFLRGFDIDHGTDISISVDGMPVNMVSHAHGQGYSDLHFLIPETIERIDFGKGPYHADRGNFATAGYVDFQTKDALNYSMVSLEYGRFNSFRAVGLFDLLPAESDHQGYIAGEYVLADGPFVSPQNFNRMNLMGKYTLRFPSNDKLSIMASHFTSKWDASGQIPQRAVDSGSISRFGAIDDTEGGNTRRTNLMLSHTKNLSSASFIKSRIFLVNYDFELYSNFTFFLRDPVNGDQIRQAETRQIFGMESVLHRPLAIKDIDFELRAGIGLRYDRVTGNELSHTLNRQTTLEPLAQGNIYESNLYGFFQTEFDLGHFSLHPGLRFDFFKFEYADQLSPVYTNESQSRGMLSPKVSLLYNPNRYWMLFLKSGIGFHSNDTRVVTARRGDQVLPPAYGLDLGTVWKPHPRLWINSALWYLFLQQEFVYVGDEAIVEPSGKTRRLGLDAGIRYQLNDRIFLDSDVNYAFARSLESPEGADYIPLAPDLTASGGVVFEHPSGFSGAARYRYIKNRPANESGSIIAKGFFLCDINASFRSKGATFSIFIENLFNAEWNEAQFATESRLAHEPEGVEELHFTPGAPFFLKGRIAYRF